MPPASAAPTAGAARRNPEPTGPTCRTSLAKAGSRAVAPPKSTANRSSDMEPRIGGWSRTKRTPDSRLRMVIGSAASVSTLPPARSLQMK